MHMKTLKIKSTTRINSLKHKQIVIITLQSNDIPLIWVITSAILFSTRNLHTRHTCINRFLKITCTFIEYLQLKHLKPYNYTSLSSRTPCKIFFGTNQFVLGILICSCNPQEIVVPFILYDIIYLLTIKLVFNVFVKCLELCG